MHSAHKDYGVARGGGGGGGWARYAPHLRYIYRRTEQVRDGMKGCR